MQQIFWERQLRKRFGTQRNRLKTFSTLATAALFLVIAGVIFVGILFAWYAKDLPRPDKVSRDEGLSTVILDRNGETIYDIFENENRIPVKFEDIPKSLKEATIAVEDKDFYKHKGLSTTGLLRAIVNIFVFHNLQGGSTLTQQLVKNALLSQEQTLPRKMKEAILAIQIEKKYTKDQILQMYLNEIPYGGTAAGVEAAASYYFDKHAKDMTVPECVILAGLPQSPSVYSPFGDDPKAYVGRTHQVLRRMREDSYITAQQEADLKKEIETVKFASGSAGLNAPHFVAYVKEQLITKFGQKKVDAGGLRVTTTLDLKLQQAAQKIVKEEVDKVKNLKVSNGAAIVIDPKTGEILVMVGSKDYEATDASGFKFNVVTQGLRQPGSTIKPISYATAFKKGYTASTLLLDVDTKYPSGEVSKPDYNPKNYDGKYRGPMQLRYALGNSINTIAVKVIALVGIKDVLRTAYDMGITTLEPTNENVSRFGLSLTLGGGEVKLIDITSAFGVLATGGMRQDPVSILKVEDVKGKVLFEHKTVTLRRVLPADVSFIVSNILSDNGARKDTFGERSYLVISGKTVAVKTGTTDDKRDNWTIGYTPSVVVGVWVGNNDNSPMNQALASGITGAAPIWNRIMKEALTGKSDEPFTRPDTIIEMDVDAYAGGTPVSDAKRKELFIKGTEPTGPSSVYQNIKISRKESNKLANAVEILRGDYDIKQFIVFKETDPISTDGKNRLQDAINAWVNGQSDSKFHPPTETYSGGDTFALSIKEPSDRAQVNDNNVKVVVKASSANGISKIEIYVDGEKKKEVNGDNFSDTVRVENGSNRSIKARAIDTKGNATESEIHVGVNTAYAEPTPVPTATPIPLTSTP
ncbi:MAG: transglycosylase domain-containing protein [Candidatus Gottesmanbacteria bacterium]